MDEIEANFKIIAELQLMKTQLFMAITVGYLYLVSSFILGYCCDEF